MFRVMVVFKGRATHIPFWNEDWACSQYEDRQHTNLLAFCQNTQQLDILLPFYSQRLTPGKYTIGPQFTSQLGLISHKWGNIKWKLFFHLIFIHLAPFIRSKPCSLVFRYRWFVLAWLHLFTYAFIYCLSICSPLMPSTVE